MHMGVNFSSVLPVFYTQKLLKCPKDPFVRSALNCIKGAIQLNWMPGYDNLLFLRKT